MIAYAYNVDNNEVVAVIEGADHRAIEAAYAERYAGRDDLGMTYTPAFGATDGLIDNDAAEQIQA